MIATRAFGPARPARLAAVALFVALFVALAAPAIAVGERVAARGPYAELGLGATGFLGDAGRYGALGPTAALRVGGDVLPFLSLGARVELASHEATVPPPPDGQYFQLYDFAADARLAVRLAALTIHVEGGLGVALISTNVLARVAITEPDERASAVLSAGGGAEYQLMNRHYAFGLAAQWSLYPAFESTQAVGGRAYLRYTY